MRIIISRKEITGALSIQWFNHILIQWIFYRWFSSHWGGLIETTNVSLPMMAQAGGGTQHCLGGESSLHGDKTF